MKVLKQKWLQKFSSLISYSADKPLLYLCTVTVSTVTLLISICHA